MICNERLGHYAPNVNTGKTLRDSKIFVEAYLLIWKDGHNIQLVGGKASYKQYLQYDLVLIS